jgi:hypothetical protein
MIIGGGSVLALSFTATTLIAGAMASTGIGGIFFAPVGGIPLAGAFPLAGLAAATGAGGGTVGTLIGLGAAQIIGFSIMIHGIVHRTPDRLEPDCRGGLVLRPLVSPRSAGLSLSGSL